jgi:hypothetical protein
VKQAWGEAGMGPKACCQTALLTDMSGNIQHLYLRNSVTVCHLSYAPRISSTFLCIKVLCIKRP